MAIVALRIIKPSIANSRLASEYNRTFVCRDYPGIGKSSNTVSDFLQRLGQDGSKRRLFYQKRAMKVASDHHIAIEGMLKQDTSTVNDISAISYKAKGKGCRDVSVIYTKCWKLLDYQHRFQQHQRNETAQEGISGTKVAMSKRPSKEKLLIRCHL